MDEAKLRLLIGSNSDFSDNIAIDILGRAHPECTDRWDGNWISARIIIHAGGFRGNYRADLRSEEFVRFHAELTRLYAVHEGSAVFETMEEQLALRLTRDRLGHIEVQGTALDDAGIGNKLMFHFEIDQSFLPKIMRELEEILAKFPVLGESPWPFFGVY